MKICREIPSFVKDGHLTWGRKYVFYVTGNIKSSQKCFYTWYNLCLILNVVIQVMP